MPAIEREYFKPGTDITPRIHEAFANGELDPRLFGVPVSVVIGVESGPAILRTEMSSTNNFEPLQHPSMSPARRTAMGALHGIDLEEELLFLRPRLGTRTHAGGGFLVVASLGNLTPEPYTVQARPRGWRDNPHFVIFGDPEKSVYARGNLPKLSENLRDELKRFRTKLVD